MYYIIYICACHSLILTHTSPKSLLFSHLQKISLLNHSTLVHYYLHTHTSLTTRPPQQKVGVYHQGSIRLVKCSSNYSQRFINSNLYDPVTIRNLRNNVRLGIWFHFAKFYILLMPFYCGVQASTIPVSYIIGLFCGFVLMWVVFCE